ncbi:MAG TPA: class I SAM-dependent methyltransferase [Candidatus Angelobacter sp.]|jgi:SAM-dependent methyltransferase|nr:class I SAM-dependent methyltransferase [Candidatus Angelobacter sp.]
MKADSKLTPGIVARNEANLSFWRMFGRHCRTSVRYYGLRHTLAQVGEAAYSFFREFLPGRRKEKYGDLDYDFDHMVDTSRATVSFHAQLTAAFSGHQYFPTEPWLFEQIMQALPIEFQDFTFVDLGSGKGRVLLMAAPHGFKRIIGVEFVPEWHWIAEENILKFAAKYAVASPLESFCMDARDFEFPSGPLVVYLFNPFPEPVLATVLEKLRQSLLTNRRQLFVAYRYPELETLMLKDEWLEKVAGTEQWAVYRNRGDRS